MPKLWQLGKPFGGFFYTLLEFRATTIKPRVEYPHEIASERIEGRERKEARAGKRLANEQKRLNWTNADLKPKRKTFNMGAPG
ncbi:MAG: hypothetical protein JWR26_3310 [Pedosphaera sp.]|nr:hypothetical protein [Pedosphaera sp.]